MVVKQNLKSKSFIHILKKVIEIDKLECFVRIGTKDKIW